MSNTDFLTAFTRSILPNRMTAEECAKLTDEELLEVLKGAPDFEKFVFPTSWHKKFPDLPKADCCDTKKYLKESPWMKKHTHYYADGGRIKEIEAKPGGVRTLLPAPDIPTITLLENHFSDGPKYQIADEHPEDSPEKKVNSTESTENKSQE